jgi:glycine cleavage system H protein
MAKLYTEDHEWIEENDGIYVIGITDHAQSELGDIVFIESEVGETHDSGDAMATIEAVKTVADLYAPFGCEVMEFNEVLEDDSAIVNSSPYDEGWIVKVKLIGELPTNLMSEDEYNTYLGE